MLSNTDIRNIIKMKEQTVPSAGYSPPQHSSYDVSFAPKFGTFGTTLSSLEEGAGFGNLAESFDLSLLGDGFDEHDDTAIVPSPGSWIQTSGAFEPSYWQQMSLYSGSPQDSADAYLAYSPDTKPLLSPPIQHFDGVKDGETNPSTNGGINRNLLLRQCLEDTSFQKKCNFKPLDIPFSKEMGPNGSEDCTRHEGAGTPLEFNQIEPVFSLAFEEVRADIRQTCAALDISPDPTDWSSVDVQSWLIHTLSSLPRMMMTSGGTPIEVVVANFWNMDGQGLHGLSEQDFLRRDPDNGDRLYANLELWKMSVQMDQVKGELKSLNLSGSGLLMPDTRLPEDISCSSGSSIGYSDTSDTCSSVDSRSPRPSILPELMQTDDDEEEEEVEKTLSTGGTLKKVSGTKSGGAHIHLWQFLKELLATPQPSGSCIRWLDQSRGVFKIEDSVRVARLWGIRKNRPAMNYDKLSRSIRQYYRKGIMRKTERSQRLVYQFCHPYGL